MEEVSKIFDEIRKKAHKSKEEIEKDLNKVIHITNNSLTSALARAKKEGKDIKEVEKEVNELLKGLKNLREKTDKMSMDDIRTTMLKYTKKVEDLLKKLGGK